MNSSRNAPEKADRKSQSPGMKRILIHLILAFTVVAAVFIGTLKFLSSYTNHGEFVLVPDVRSQSIATLDTFMSGKGVTYQIIDSIYDPKEKAGKVIRQDPDPGSKVKHNRKVYLYVTCQVPPQIAMPRLIDRSERQARFIIEAYGLRVGSVGYEKADCNGCVIAQNVRGRQVQPGSPVKKGSVVNLVVGMKDAYFMKDSIPTGTN
jgi:eukaryotic-like serine/threonine-protein kinase